MNREEAKLKAAVFLDHLSIKGYEWEENAEDLEDQIENNRVAYKIKKIDRPRVFVYVRIFSGFINEIISLELPILVRYE